MAEKLQFILELDDQGSAKLTRFRGELDKTGSTAEATGNRLKSAFESAGNSAVRLNQALELAAKGIDLAKRGIDAIYGASVGTGAELERLSRRFSLSTQGLGSFAAAAAAVGVPVDSLGPALRGLSAAMVEAQRPGTVAAAIFKQLQAAGLDLAKVLKEGPQQRLIDLAQVLQKFDRGDPQFLAGLTQLFQRGALPLNQLAGAFKDFETFLQKAKAAGLDFSDAQLKAASRVENAFTALGFAVRGLFKAFGSPDALNALASGLEHLFDVVSSPEVRSALSDLSTEFARYLQTISPQDVKTAIGDTAEAIKVISGAIRDLADVLRRFQSEGLGGVLDDVLKREAQNVATPQGLAGIAARAAGVLSRVTPGPLGDVLAGGGLAGSLRPPPDRAGTFDVAEQLASQTAAATGKAGRDLQIGLGQYADALKDQFGGAVDDVTDKLKHLKVPDQATLDLQKKLADLRQTAADAASGLSDIEIEARRMGREFGPAAAQAAQLFLQIKQTEALRKLKTDLADAADALRAFQDPSFQATAELNKLVRAAGGSPGSLDAYTQAVTQATQATLDFKHATEAGQFAQKLQDQLEELNNPATKFAHQLRDLRTQALAFGPEAAAALDPLIVQLTEAQRTAGAFLDVFDLLGKAWDELLTNLASGTLDMAKVGTAFKQIFLRELGDAFAEGFKLKLGFEGGVKLNLVQFLGNLGQIISGQATGAGGIGTQLVEGVFGPLVSASGTAGGTGTTGTGTGVLGSIFGGGGGGLGSLLNLGNIVSAAQIFTGGSALFSGRSLAGTDFGLGSSLQSLGLAGSKAALPLLLHLFPGLANLPIIGALLGGGAAGLLPAGSGVLAAAANPFLGFGTSLAAGGGVLAPTAGEAGFGSIAGGSAVTGGSSLVSGLASLISVVGSLVSIALSVKGVVDTSHAFSKATLGAPESRNLAIGGGIGVGVGAGIGAAVGAAASGPYAPVGAAIGAAIGAAVAQAIHAAIASAIGGAVGPATKEGLTQAEFRKTIAESPGIQILFGNPKAVGPTGGGFAAPFFGQKLLDLFVPDIEVIFNKLFAKLLNQLGFPGANASLTGRGGGGIAPAELRALKPLEGDAQILARILATLTGAGRDNADRITRFTNIVVNSLAKLGTSLQKGEQILFAVFREAAGRSLVGGQQLVATVFPAPDLLTRVSGEKRSVAVARFLSGAGITTPIIDDKDVAATKAAWKKYFDDTRAALEAAGETSRQARRDARAITERAQAERFLVRSFEPVALGANVQDLVNTFQQGNFQDPTALRRSQRAVAKATPSLFQGDTVQAGIEGFLSAIQKSIQDAFIKGLGKILQPIVGDIFSEIFGDIRKGLRRFRRGNDPDLSKFTADLQADSERLAKVLNDVGPALVKVITAEKDAEKALSDAIIKADVQSGDLAGAQQEIESRLSTFIQTFQGFQDLLDNVTGRIADALAGDGFAGAEAKIATLGRRADQAKARLLGFAGVSDLSQLSTSENITKNLPKALELLQQFADARLSELEAELDLAKQQKDFFTQAADAFKSLREQVDVIRRGPRGQRDLITQREAEVQRLAGAARRGDQTAINTIQKDLADILQLGQESFAPGSGAFQEILAFVDQFATEFEQSSRSAADTANDHIDAAKAAITDFQNTVVPVLETLRDTAKDQLQQALQDIADSLGDDGAIAKLLRQIGRGLGIDIHEPTPKTNNPSAGPPPIPSPVIPTPVVGDQTPVSFFSGRAMGGLTVPGSTYLVGEQGPELFTPSVSGQILTHGDTRQVLDHIEARANGGTVTAGQTYWVGERGEEMFVPGTGSRSSTAAPQGHDAAPVFALHLAPGAIVIQDGRDPEAVARAVETRLARKIAAGQSHEIVGAVKRHLAR